MEFNQGPSGMSPSKYCSVKFLTELALDNYISPRGKEYCPEEVEILLNEKIEAYNEQFLLDQYAEFMEEEERQDTYLGVYIVIKSINSGSL